jgi:nitrogen fixation NifU-like protein
MSSDLNDLYQEVILDHNRRPRNFRAIAGGRKAEGYNPLCGDRLTVYLRVDDGRVEDVSFEGAGCAISTASASLMTDAIKGRSVDDVEALVDRFHRMLTGPSAAPAADLGKLAVLAGVREFPLRVKCASLPWHTLRAALQHRQDTVSTE